MEWKSGLANYRSESRDEGQVFLSSVSGGYGSSTTGFPVAADVDGHILNAQSVNSYYIYCDNNCKAIHGILLLIFSIK